MGQGKGEMMNKARGDMMETVLTKRQRLKFGPKVYDNGTMRIIANVRYDDQCGNGHNTFSITADIQQKRGNAWVTWGGGCCHDEVARHFPELQPFIKWHLVSSDGPLHYIVNAMYLAGDKDYNGRRAGEVSGWSYAVKFGNSPVSHCIKRTFSEFLEQRKDSGGEFRVIEFVHDKEPETYSPNYTLIGYGERWHECPFHNKVEADEFAAGMNKCNVEFVKLPTSYSKGKVRELDAARSCAVWPDATDEDLTAPGLKERLEARLPGLIAEFREAIENLGLVF